MADEDQLWSQRDAVREYTRLARVSESLFTALGALAPRLADPSATIAAATLARRLGVYAAAWAALVPESVLLEDARASAPEVPPIDAEEGAVRQSIAALRADLEALLARTSPVADGAARRVTREVLADLDGGTPPSIG